MQNLESSDSVKVFFSEHLIFFSFFALLVQKYCQTPVLGLGLGVDFTFANNNKKKKKINKNPHLNLPRRNGTMGMKFGTQT